MKIAKSKGYRCVGHPASNVGIKRVHNKFDEEREEKPPLIRNKDIVNESDILIAAPNSFKELLGSGTWATVRYARKNNKKIYIIYLDGNVVE